jgi:hypothetical protein
MTDQATKKSTTLDDLLADAPKNWGRWGPDDEVGALNFLTPAEVLRGVQSVKQGKVITIGMAIGNKGGDPVWPGRMPAQRLYTFLYTAAPIKFKNATGAPVNPVVIK